jgi:hypothetical protein
MEYFEPNMNSGLAARYQAFATVSSGAIRVLPNPWRHRLSQIGQKLSVVVNVRRPLSRHSMPVEVMPTGSVRSWLSRTSLMQDAENGVNNELRFFELYIVSGVIGDYLPAISGKTKQAILKFSPRLGHIVPDFRREPRWL